MCPIKNLQQLQVDLDVLWVNYLNELVVSMNHDFFSVDISHSISVQKG